MAYITDSLLGYGRHVYDNGIALPKGSKLTSEFADACECLREDGTADELWAKWTGSDEDAKTIPEQDWPGTRASDIIRSRTMEAFFPLFATAAIYFALCCLVAWVLGLVAQRLDWERCPRVIAGVTTSAS